MDKENLPPYQGGGLTGHLFTGPFFRIALALVAAHIIVVYGEPEPVFSMMLNKDYYIAVGGSFIIAYLLISYVFHINQMLDRRLDWESGHLIERIFYQLLLSLIAPGILAFLLAALYFHLRGVNILHTSYLRYDFQYIMTMLICLNIYYFAIYQTKVRRADRALLREQQRLLTQQAEQMKSMEEKSKLIPLPKVTNMAEPEQVLKQIFQAHTPLMVVPVTVEQICYFFRQNHHNFLHTLTGDVYAIPESLKEIEQLVGGRYFFRINRQMVVSFKSCISFRPGKNKTIELTLYPPFNIRHRDEGTIEGGSAYVTVTEDRVPAFRDWMDR